MGKRLVSLDVLRGITVAGMILVNNAGDSYAPLKHAAWNGLTPCDLVFPFFLFIMGISTYISLNKSGFKFSGPLALKIMKRTLLLMLICWAIAWFDHACYGDFFPFGHLRLTGVLPRIALCYCVVSMLALSIPHRWFPYLAGVLLIGYSIMLLTGDGYANDGGNILAGIDRFLLGEEHLYSKQPVDPEGLISNISAIAHTMIGFCCGKVLMKSSNVEKKVINLFAIGFVLLAVGFLFTYLLPLNKRIWSPTFALVTCGFASMLLALLTKVIDMDGSGKWYDPFLIYGVNPLFIYVLSEVFAIAFGVTGLSSLLYDGLHFIFRDVHLTSLMYALTFTLLLGLIGYPLYKKKIYIKL